MTHWQYKCRKIAKIDAFIGITESLYYVPETTNITLLINIAV